MRLLPTYILSVLLLVTCLPDGLPGQITDYRDDFHSLEHWKHYKFPNVDRATQYEITVMGKDTVLKTSSDNSASLLLLRKTFEVDSFPVLEWKWKVENIYEKGDEITKAGDDYALRIYVNFKYDPSKASLWERTKYSVARSVFGKYPPHSALSYIWANTEHEKRILPNPFQEKAQMVITREGESGVGEWHTERVNILADYREAFGAKPPDIASLAIMNDSDGTGESSVSYLDYILLEPAE
ncbi:MAG: DUF3047 domain-containing protein [Candidatus Marinimicrobia bacterium]|nr:DUF3047 domain-containing protein [Candidatus Neomarinimicrobiota bacterium]MCF7828129.1 DUF3047 domain-containing protein [Candidatus Neomarinimicrobiota bacterium]MCF7879696.1 DUF3047 domain-containing protein [Candidatus Neomarinimicrobiota bacterium]